MDAPEEDGMNGWWGRDGDECGRCVVLRSKEKNKAKDMQARRHEVKAKGRINKGGRDAVKLSGAIGKDV